MPGYARRLAFIAGCYLMLTFIMLLLGMFSFDAKPGSGSADGANALSPAPETNSAEPAVSAEPAGGPPLQTNVSLTVRSVRGGVHEKEFTWYMDEAPLQLSVIVSPEPARDSETRPRWESSDISVFTVDETGLLEPVSIGSGELIVTYGQYSTSVRVHIMKNAPLPGAQPPADSQSDETPSST
jgi:hypothetical protein